MLSSRPRNRLSRVQTCLLGEQPHLVEIVTCEYRSATAMPIMASLFP